ncbi:2OG-Fe(II) oxygenase [Actibacterium sp. 188UL27-1]|uniref:2OG-Fe(II) oxygenase n=1 Tax=Actibacterium sp. 188UL27-1 TaxID=2786961 RepID=UPI0019593AA6|nr:2OG-Fe(II) oxygenase [Actibacterium sp. 188UL27-1]MBM7068169.1 2OG-Fe(II) oxygenase [Actibacterium sp. 188UL27-1]
MKTTRFTAAISTCSVMVSAGGNTKTSPPLPGVIQELRQSLYPALACIANQWEVLLGTGKTWPDRHTDLIDLCRAADQIRPTPLILRYGPEDFNALHQDIYGELTFPLQVVILLSPPCDFEGGAFVLTEQRPRMQSRAEVVPLCQTSTKAPPPCPAIISHLDHPPRGSRTKGPGFQALSIMCDKSRLYPV